MDEELARRLKTARGLRGWKSAAEAAEKLGVPYGTYSGHENGTRGISRDRLIDYARKLRVSLGWLMTGEGLPRGNMVPVVGVAGAGPDGAVHFGEGDGELGEAPVPPHATPRTVAVEVRGQSMRGLAEDGWLVYYDDRRDPPTEDFLGKVCVVGLVDGRVLVKKLIRGRKRRHFDLESAAAPTLHDVRVEWAAPVIAIVPQYAARRGAA